MLSLTACFLEKNPEVYTFWNIRRQVINLFLKVEELLSLAFSYIT